MSLTGDHWLAFECVLCSVERAGVALDLRLPRAPGTSVPAVRCPCCGKPMDYRGYWKADEGGYGSRASSDVTALARAAEGLTIEQCAERAEAFAEDHSEVDDPDSAMALRSFASMLRMERKP